MRLHHIVSAHLVAAMSVGFGHLVAVQVDQQSPQQVSVNQTASQVSPLFSGASSPSQVSQTQPAHKTKMVSVPHPRSPMPASPPASPAPVPPQRPAPPPPPPQPQQDTFYDSVDTSNIPSCSNPTCGVASYVNGLGGFQQSVSNDPSAFHIAIDARGDAPNAYPDEALDIEPGAAPNSSVHQWNQEENASGHWAVDYTFISNLPTVEQAAAGTNYRIWVADPQSTDGAPVSPVSFPGAQATQYNWNGDHWDVSITTMPLDQLFGSLP